MSILTEPVLGKFPELIEISNSEIQTFKSDKRRWYLGNYLGLAKNEKSEVGPLPLGTRIHDSLEQYYLTGDNPVDVYNRLQRADNERFIATSEALMEDMVKKFNDESELGRVMLEGYMDWMDEENPDSHLEIVGAEKKLEYRLTEFNPRVQLVGKVDLQVRRLEDDSRATLDHKSAVQFTDYYKYAHMSEQLMMYTMLERLNPDEGNTRVDGGIYNLLKKVKRSARAKPPFYERIDVRFNEKTMDAFWIRTLGTIRDIMVARDALDNGADHRYICYPNPSWDWKTGSSPFFPVYSMLDDGSNVEAYLEENFHQVNPNARYEIQEQTN
jgi:hypothetical protein